MSMNMMNGSTFWNINDGKRDRFDVFGEWEARWSGQWLSQLGLRSSTVWMDTGDVQGYNPVDYGNPANPNSIPGAFNAADRSRTDHNLDLTALLRFTPDAQQTYEAGFARKTRSPNLYERYAWSTNNTMTMTMINWFGDGNGYVGNLDLKPEVANTISATASWHDAAREQWGFNVTPYYTYVQDYIDARRCSGGAMMSPCDRNNVTARQASSTSSSSINRSPLRRRRFRLLPGAPGRCPRQCENDGGGELRQGQEPGHRRQPLPHHALEREAGAGASNRGLDQHPRRRVCRRQDQVSAFATSWKPVAMA
jgi:hypothetical protein